VDWIGQVLPRNVAFCATVGGVIEDVHEDADRAQVQQFLQSIIPGIAPNAVPMSASDGMYSPVIMRAVDDDGHLVGAALSCRAQVAAMASALRGRTLPRLGDFGPVLDAHSELDLLAVAPEVRCQGIGSSLLSAVEGRLRERGVHCWFGNVTPAMDVNRLRSFYSRHGFEVGLPGRPLPPLLGREWVMPGTPPAAFFFWRRL
jgi:GNAT superfamily N-acetyltransferase